MGLFNKDKIRLTVCGLTDVGQTRQHNEDRFLVADLATNEASNSAGENKCALGPKGAVLIVADGMGGASAGEIASQMATDLIYERLATAWRADPDLSPEAFARHVRDSVEATNALIHAQSVAQAELHGMGTTVTLVGILGPNLLITQVGDSRAYLVRDGAALQVSRDQSYVQHLIDTGRVSEEQAQGMAAQNVILQALGVAPTVEPVQSWEAAQDGDTLLLCSDGLSGLVNDDEIASVVTGEQNLHRACEQLVSLANSRGGPDNITVVLARLNGDGLPTPEEGTGGGVAGV